MTFGYVTSENQILSADEQRLKIEEWCRKKNIQVEKFIQDEQVKTALHSGDVVVVENIGVFGKSVKIVLEEISAFLADGVTIYSTTWNEPVRGEEMARAFSITLETFNSIVLNSTKVGLNRAKQEGRVGGRKPGQKPSKTKLTAHKEEIQEYLSQGLSKRAIAKKFKVSWNTVDLFVRERLSDSTE